ncbi:amine sulfotransferase-like isoform X1 [Ranitomeya imitator]|uniref:amine sulfotransferase-like isoform X1 n=1 Tax=Ranitomeya imitator TaxID=111125 RepID=UPI0037E8A728
MATMDQDELCEALNAISFKHKGIYFETNLTSPEVIDNVEHMEIRDGDVFLVTYPKSGTIWTQQILSLIFNEGHRNRTEEIQTMDRVPWLEFKFNNVDYNSRPSPRLFSTHLPYYLMPKDLRFRMGKIIYVSRNPKDVLVSYYHFLQMKSQIKCTINWETFIDLFISGKVFGSSWFDHLRGWYQHKEDFDILFLTYEEMIKQIAETAQSCQQRVLRREIKVLMLRQQVEVAGGEIGSVRDLRSAVLKICKFVDIKLDDKAIDIVVEKATFKNMKHDPLANYTFVSNEHLDKNKGSFLRKGIVGDWKTTMTVAQSEMFDKVYKEKMGDLPIKITWDFNEETAS